MRSPYLDDGDVRLYLGDCAEVMREMDPDSVDAVVCDPPYGLEFMGKDWDAPWAGKASPEFSSIPEGDLGGFRALPQHSRVNNVKCRKCNRWKFSGTPCKCAEPDFPDARRMAMVEFEEWCARWATSALRVLKPGGHLLAFGGTRTFHRLTCGIEDAGFEIRDCLSWLYGSGFPKSLDVSKAIDKAAGAEREVVGTTRTNVGMQGGNFASGGATGEVDVTAPATDAAREWEGWGTALKPAWEPCVVARKPLAGTVAANVQAHSTGALNIDGCRIGTDDTLGRTNNGREHYAPTSFTVAPSERTTYDRSDGAGGRWPANVALDEQAAEMLDAQSGERPTGDVRPYRRANTNGYSGAQPAQSTFTRDGDTGGASRFYYTAKASRADRNTSGANNTHPTVKPTDLMRWLVRLVTPPGGVVLDPFAGSGSTLVAARAEGVRAIGIEQAEEYAAIISDRLSQLSLFSEGV